MGASIRRNRSPIFTFHNEVHASPVEFVEEGRCGAQIGCLRALGKAIVDLGHELHGLAAAALLRARARETEGGAALAAMLPAAVVDSCEISAFIAGSPKAAVLLSAAQLEKSPLKVSIWADRLPLV